MKKKHYLKIAMAVLLGLLATAWGITYDAYTPITDVHITGSLWNGISVPINTCYTMTCSTSTDTDHYCDETGDHYPNDPVTHTWSGAGTFNPTTGTSVTWTSPSSTGNKTITVTADDSPLCDETAKTDSITVVVVRVTKIQYYDPDSGWTDAGTLHVHVGTTVQFKAIPDPGTAAWPSGKPVWGGTSGASGSSATTSVTFNQLSTSTTDYKTVTATCGNTGTVNVVVYDLTGGLTPADNFSGRSQTQYGLEEFVNLSHTTNPAGITGLPLQWKKTAGVGTLNGITYDAGHAAGNVTLKLEITAGPSKGRGPSYTRTVITPSGGYMIQKPGTGIRHTHNTCSCGFLGISYITPKEVSFTNLQTREGSCYATASGCYAHWDELLHEENPWFAVDDGDSTTGCKEGYSLDEVWSGDVIAYSEGDFLWPIPKEYKADDGEVHTFTASEAQHAVADDAGKCTISKYGAGPFSKNAGDAASSW
jgi:hypothetical protein